LAAGRLGGRRCHFCCKHPVCCPAAGIPAKVVSERLGHATIQITLDTYSHVLPGLDAQAAETVARLILGDGPASTDVSKA
jgi:integrase